MVEYSGVIPYSADAGDFVDVDVDMHWECKMCGSCCGNVFSMTWLDTMLVNYIGDPVDGFCRHFDRKSHKCMIREKRPIICRSYPFLITKRDGIYRLQIHSKCPGIGSGKRIDIRYIAEELVRYCEEEFCIDFIIGWEGENLRLCRIK